MAVRKIQTAGAGPVPMQNAIVPRHFLIENLATISAQYPNGTVQIDFPVGDYVYAGHLLALTNSVAIAGETVAKYGRHYIQTAHLSKYIKNIKVLMNGNTEWDLDVDTKIKINEYLGLNTTDGILHLRFGGPERYRELAAEEVYALGTANLMNHRVIVELTDQFDPATMQIRCLSEHARVRRPAGFVNNYWTQYATATSSGQFEIGDLPFTADIAAFYVFAEGINSAELVVDGRTAFKGPIYELQSLHEIHGKHNWEALGGGFALDFIRSGNHLKHLLSMDNPVLQRRNASIRLKLNLMNANTDVTIVSQVSGPLNTQK